MKRRRDNTKGVPRTGTGDAPRGKKPTEIGILQMRSGSTYGRPAESQPKGWGIARVVDIFTRKERGNG